jgi:hypothetical protein
MHSERAKSDEVQPKSMPQRPPHPTLSPEVGARAFMPDNMRDAVGWASAHHRSPASGQSGEGRKQFFFEKKNQKTFTSSLWPQARAQ